MSLPSVVAVSSSSPEETRELGVRIGRRLRAGDLILLHADLGGGKTTLAQGIAMGLGVPGPVQSPTFTLAAEYDGIDAAGRPVKLYHLDLYRLTSTDELDTFGFDDYLAASDGVTIVEWPERAGALLFGPYLLIRLEITGVDQRRLTFQPVPNDGPYTEWLADLRRDLDPA